MHLKVEQAIDSIKSSLLTSTHTRSFYNKPSTQNKKKAWSGIDDGLKIFKLYRRFLRVQFAFTLILAIFFVNLFAYYQLDILYLNDEASFVFRSLISTSIASILTCILRFQSRKQMALARREQPTSFPLLFLELIILLIQPYPFLQQIKVSRVSMSNQDLNPLKLNHILVVISLMKLILFGRGMLNFLTPYNNPRNFRIYKIYGLTNNPLNIVRNLFRQHPVIIISILYIFSMLIFAYSYRILENGASEDQILNYFEGSLWLAVLTMTTVGYGDVKPCTSFGVVITVISSFIGVIGTSLFVLSITTNLEMNYKQQRSLHILRRFRNRRQQKIVSGMFIRICLWRLWQQYKLKQSFKVSNEERKLKRQISEMNQQAKRIFKQSSLFQEVMQQQFEIVRCHITSILENCDQMLQYCSNKEQVIEGVIKNMQSYKHETKKLEFMQENQNGEKGVKIWVQMVEKTNQM